MEVFMVRKAKSLEFAGGAWVFPGGAVDEEDRNPGWHELFPEFPPGRLSEELPDLPREDALGAYVAALRELLEEAGVLLTSWPLDHARSAEIRQQVLRGGSFLESVRKHGLMLNPERLTYFAHWITPEIYPIRFDTRFFLAEIPPEANPSPDGHETREGIWIAPSRALARPFPLMPPTRVTLQELSHFNAPEDAATWGKKRTKIPRLPWVDAEGALHIPDA